MFLYRSTAINVELQINAFILAFIADVYYFIIFVYFNNFCICQTKL